LHYVRKDNGIHPVNSPAPRRDHIDILTSVCDKKKSLGNSGLKISKVILGTMSYGSSQWQDWVLDEDKALPLIEHAYKQGINTWDTVGFEETV
jgi:hypothetical protein